MEFIKKSLKKKSKKIHPELNPTEKNLIETLTTQLKNSKNYKDVSSKYSIESSDFLC